MKDIIVKKQAMYKDFSADSKADKPENNLPTSLETLTSDEITTQQIENDTAEIGTMTQAHSQAYTVYTTLHTSKRHKD